MPGKLHILGRRRFDRIVICLDPDVESGVVAAVSFDGGVCHGWEVAPKAKSSNEWLFGGAVVLVAASDVTMTWRLGRVRRRMVAVLDQEWERGSSDGVE
jgi:hypothetical protein